MFVSLDLETTGFDPKNDRIIEFGAIKFDLEGNEEKLSFLVNPDTPIPQIVTHITNISDKDVKNAPRFEEKLEEVMKFIGDLPIIGHNIQFDTNFLAANGIPRVNPEYDTCQMASILAPGLPSYSLEILSEIFNLSHEEAHRALDDAIASQQLFLRLAEEFQKLSPEMIAKIHKLCEKTDWPLKKFILTLNHKDAKATSTEKIIEKFSFTKPENYNQLIDAGKTALIEEPAPFNHLAKTLINDLDKDSYLALHHDLFRQIEQDLPDNIAKIDAPKRYLSLKRLETFQNKDFFGSDEFSALLKFLIWSEKTKTGLLSEVKLFNEEIELINKVNIDENIVKAEDEYYFKKALEKDENNAAICTHEYIIEKNPELNDLVILDFAQFEQTLYNHSSKYFKIEIILSPLLSLEEIEPENQTVKSLISKAEMFFGLIGLLFEKYNDRNPFTARTIISKNSMEHKEWQDAKSMILSLIEVSKELGEINNEQTFGYLQNWKNVLKNLHEIFITPDLRDNMIWIEKDFLENILLRQAPSSLKEDFNAIIEKCQNYKLIGENLDLEDNAQFIRDLFGIDPEIPLYKDSPFKEDTQIFITDDTPEREANEITLINELTKFITKKRGKIALLFNSKAKLKQFTLELGDKLDGTDIHIVSQLTGALGKLRQKFKRDPENSILLVTPHFWDKFKDYELIDTLFIHKIPFDPPSDPYITTTSRNFENAFVQFQIPLAIFGLKRTINRLQNGVAVVLDSRISTKPYGKAFMANLNNQAGTEIINLSSIQTFSQDQ